MHYESHSLYAKLELISLHKIKQYSKLLMCGCGLSYFGICYSTSEQWGIFTVFILASSRQCVQNTQLFFPLEQLLLCV